jgi:transaldolase
VTDRLERLREAGVSIWLDVLSRDLLESGEFAALVRDRGVSGATSNPTIFAKAITTSDRYDGQLRAAVAAGVRTPQELFLELGLEDIRRAAAILRPVHRSSGGADGFVSFECTPDLADDADATVAQATKLWKRLDLPNVMIKVPATDAGVIAIEQLTVRGINVNVTLLFSVDRYEQVIEAYLTGLERRVAEGAGIDSLRSVASFFVSRVDGKVDPQLDASSALRGRVAIANARRAYARYRARFAGERWQRLHQRGAMPQRPLWASTGTKDPAYSDVLYVEELIAPDVINTMPEATLLAFADHGEVSAFDPDPAEVTLAEAAAAGIELRAITAELEREGVAAFCASYDQLLRCIEAKAARLALATT